MRIAYFIGVLKKEDGVAQVILALVREAEKRGLSQTIVTGWVEEEGMTSAPIIRIPSVIFPIYRDYRIPLPGVRRFARQLDMFRPDIIHINSPDPSAWAAVRYARSRNIPIIATHHTNFMRDLSYYHVAFLRPVVWSLLKQLYSRMDAVTTPSTVTTGELVAKGIPRVETIPWGADQARFNPSFRSDAWRGKILGEERGGGTILLSMCRLAWEKNLRVLAETYRILQSKRNDFAMVVAGNGPARVELERLMPGAIFLGHLDGAELSRVYASSDLLLFPSDRETFGNVTIEAMASGVVPIAANAGGSRTIVIDGTNGFLVPPDSATGFYEKTSQLLDDPAIRIAMRSAALEHAKNFTWDHVFETVLALYQRVAGSRPKI